ncbi:hypothetical protein PRZ48_011267 [Zasmidium cellare]|uniref:Uncharacterized protein n=1 Tax=Zasmidium cellare TaxID=395010 RepID=A0ABR0EC23_ZASCE|nr:hypothetical protein PRZ48_011267 [Zasmidium cellare]
MPYNDAAPLFDSLSTTLNFNDPKAHVQNKKVIHIGTASDKLLQHEVHPVTVTDVRACKDQEFTPDSNGFQYFNEPTALAKDDFFDTDVVKERYWPEVAELLKKATGASHAQYESHLIRSSRWEDVQAEARQVKEQEGEKGMCQKMDPNRSTHVSQKEYGSILRSLN